MNWASNEDETKTYLLSQNISPMDEFLRYQVLYSGYELTIKDHPGKSFSASLFSIDQIKKNEKLEMEKAGDRLLEFCGSHKTAQFPSFLTDKGEICTLDDENMPNIFCSSFDQMLEEYALRNEIYNWKSNPYYYKVNKVDQLIDLMNYEFQPIKECTDSYSIWWQSNNLIAVKGIWMDGVGSYFHVYGKKRNECDALIERLMSKEILR